MEVEYITDQKGRKKSVVVPIKEWESILSELEEKRILLGMKDAFAEVKEVLHGKKRLKSIEEILDEL